MLYRPFGKLGYDVSAFGVGLMRLPVLENSGIDHDVAAKMVHYAIDNGVNYFDTAYVYHDEESESFFGAALRPGDRDKIKIATKMPVWDVKNADDAKRMLDTQLERLKTDYIDCYLMHALDRNRWAAAKEIGLPKLFEQFRDEGLIKAICFSYHDDADTFRDIINENDWDMAQVQMNYMDIDNQATLEGISYAHDKGLAVVIMEPLRGGSLTKVPADVQKVFTECTDNRTPSEWAFRYMLDVDCVSTILSGVSTMEQLQQNVELFGKVSSSNLNDTEKEIFNRVKGIFDARTKVPCTGCAYCLPCPEGVAIPEVFTHENYASMMDDLATGKRRYSRLIDSGNDASKCIECAACESLCPQHIDIINELKAADTYLR